jgi:hypothetical protein
MINKDLMELCVRMSDKLVADRGSEPWNADFVAGILYGFYEQRDVVTGYLTQKRMGKAYGKVNDA